MLVKLLDCHLASAVGSQYITKTCLCNIQKYFSAVKIENSIKVKNFDIFNIFALNIDCRYTLEPPL